VWTNSSADTRYQVCNGPKSSTEIPTQTDEGVVEQPKIPSCSPRLGLRTEGPEMEANIFRFPSAVLDISSQLDRMTTCRGGEDVVDGASAPTLEPLFF
jgi:hypothetical protein